MLHTLLLWFFLLRFNAGTHGQGNVSRPVSRSNYCSRQSKALNQKKWPANGYTNIHYFYIYIHIDHIVYPLLNTYIAIHKNDTSAKPWHQVFPLCSKPEAGTTIMREPEAGTIPSAAKKGRSNDILRTCECVALPRYLCSGLNPCALYRTLA